MLAGSLGRELSAGWIVEKRLPKTEDSKSMGWLTLFGTLKLEAEHENGDPSRGGDATGAPDCCRFVTWSVLTKSCV